MTSLLSGDLLSYLLITFSLCISLSLVYRGPHLPPRSSFPLVSIAPLCLLGIEGDPFLTHSVCVDRSVFWVLREVHFFAFLFVPIAFLLGIEKCPFCLFRSLCLLGIERGPFCLFRSLCLLGIERGPFCLFRSLCLLGIEKGPLLPPSVCSDRSVFWVLRKVPCFPLLCLYLSVILILRELPPPPPIPVFVPVYLLDSERAPTPLSFCCLCLYV